MTSRFVTAQGRFRLSAAFQALRLWAIVSLLLIAAGCGDEAGVARHGVPLALRIRFETEGLAAPGAGDQRSPEIPESGPDGDGAPLRAADIAGIEQLVLSAYTPGSPRVLQARERLTIAPGQTRFRAELNVPPAEAYEIEVKAEGFLGIPGNETERGTLYFGATELSNVTEGSSHDAEVVVRKIVPTPRIERNGTTRFTVRWTPIPTALRYRVRETPAGGLARDVVTSDVAHEVEILGLRAAGSEAIAYRVSAELADSVSSAFSDSVAITLPGNVAPAAVSDLVVESLSPETLTLAWTAPGDDDQAGQATAYDLRSSFSPIDGSNFDLATVVLGVPAPSPAGRLDRLVLNGLLPETTYYFALKTRDEVPNWSELSNVVVVTTPPLPDLSAPAAVTDLTITAIRDGEIDLSWTASGDDGTVGTASLNDLRFSLSEITAENFSAATPAVGAPLPTAPGTLQSATLSGLPRQATVFLALVVRDESGNASPPSNVVSGFVPDLSPPNVVNSLIARPSSAASITLEWSASGDDGAVGRAAAYDLRYATTVITESNFATATPVSGAPAPGEPGSAESLEVTGLARLTSYFFALKVRDDAGNFSVLSNVASATTLDAVPAAPTGLRSTAVTPTTISLEWTDNADNETSYLVERIDPNDPNFIVRFALQGAIQGTGRFTDEQLIDRTLYRYRVFARNAVGNSAPSNDLIVRSGVRPPSNLIATTLSASVIRLSWDYSPPDPDLFVIESRSTSGEWTPVNTIPGAGRVHDVTGLAPSTDYSFRLRARAGTDLSEPSNEATARTVDPSGVCDITPLSLDFDVVAVGASASASIQIENIGDGVLNGQAQLESNCIDFAITGGGAPYSLAPGEFHSITVRFSPTAIGNRSCNLLAGINCSPVPLAGTGDEPPACDLVPNFWDFGEVTIGESASTVFAVINRGGSRLEGTLAQTSCPGFTITSGLGPYSLANGERHTFGVSFVPTLLQKHVCELDVGCGDGWVIVGTGAPGPICELDPAVLGFGPVEAGTRMERLFTIINRGTGLLTGDVVLSGCSNAFELVSGGGPFSLGGNQGKDVVIAFTPPTAGEFECLVENGLACGSLLVSGIGTDPPVCQLSTATLDFLGVDAGTSEMLSFTIQNVGGGVLSGVVTPAEGCAFSGFTIVSGDGPYNLAAGQMHTVYVRFAPTEVGFRDCQINLGTACANPVQVVGQGVNPDSHWTTTFGTSPIDGLVLDLNWINGQLVVSGGFENLVGGDYKRIAGWNGSSWLPYDFGLPAQVEDVTSFQGSILAAGQFDSYGWIARFVGGSWLALDLGLDNYVNAATTWDGGLVVAGAFETVDFSTPVRGVAQWNIGAGFTAMGDGLPNLTNALYVWNNQLFAGGYYFSEGLEGIAQWSGSSWVPVGGGIGVINDEYVMNFATYQNKLVAVGDFSQAGNISANDVALWDGITWQSLGSGTNGVVYAAAEYQGDLVITGSFTQAGGRECNNIARWDGNEWQPMGSGLTGQVSGVLAGRALAVNGDELIVGGMFFKGGPYESPHIARYFKPLNRPEGGR